MDPLALPPLSRACMVCKCAWITQARPVIDSQCQSYHAIKESAADNIGTRVFKIPDYFVRKAEEGMQKGI
jgi:hypothetical protein